MVAWVQDVVDRVATKFRATPDVVYALVPVAKVTSRDL